jgi:CubicO group peptidase (beta-lactamase class C family)
VSDPALDQVASWPVDTAAAAVIRPDGTTATTGPTDHVFAWASLTKVLTALATWIAVEEGTLAWDEPLGPPGSTLRHLLAHASGLGTDDDRVLAPPATRRIYSNRGIELVAERLRSAAAMPFGAYLSAAVLEPLGMSATVLDGSAASGASGPLVDLARLGHELLRPTLVSPETLRVATSVAFPGLDGVLPGFGRRSPNDWGLGIEIRGDKVPHWTATTGSPRTFGHFGRAGGFLWVDPDADLAAGALTDRDFDDWSKQAWPTFADAVLAEDGAQPVSAHP